MIEFTADRLIHGSESATHTPVFNKQLFAELLGGVAAPGAATEEIDTRAVRARAR
ncbi:hypothetical protein ATCCBAA256_37610 [Mycobacterium montefiorense]|nr:hypothetical protein ATCCBAA256_37610 [Mycobacterium montefiorense]